MLSLRFVLTSANGLDLQCKINPCWNQIIQYSEFDHILALILQSPLIYIREPF